MLVVRHEELGSATSYPAMLRTEIAIGDDEGLRGPGDKKKWFYSGAKVEKE
jgi:hypothetical protein